MNSILRRTQQSSSAKSGSRPNRPVTLYLIRLMPTCRIVWLYLIQHKIPYELIDMEPEDIEEVTQNIDNDGGNGKQSKAPSLPEDCPHRQVPILTDGDVTVFEAPSILRYLSSRYTNYDGYGSTLSARMMTESLISWINSELYRLVAHQITYPQVFKDCMLPSASANEVMVECGMKHVTRVMESIEKRYLKNHDYLGGYQMTVADSFAATVLIQLQWVGFSFKLWPKTGQWLDNVKQQEFWTDVHSAHEIFLEEFDN